VFLKKTLGPLWRLDLADRNLVELTYLDLILSQLEKIFEDETLGHEVLDTLIILAEGVIDGISSPPRTRQQGRDLSILNDTPRTLVRCLSLSKHCGVDTHLAGLMRGDSLDSLIKVLGDLDGRLGRHAHSHPPSRVTHASSKRQWGNTICEERRHKSA